MNRVLVTGLALGKVAGVCDFCQFDFSWIINRPSVLLWTDKILVTEKIWDAVSNAQYPHDNKEVAQSLKLVFEIGRGEKIIEVINSPDFITKELIDEIYKQVEEDRILLARSFPTHFILGNEEEVPGHLFFDGLEYCVERLWPIYAAFVLSKALGAYCLFDDKDLNFCKYKFLLTGFPSLTDHGFIEAFQSVFNAYIPNCEVFPEYVYMSKDACATCRKMDSCKDKYLSEVESNLKHIIRWRNYDEIQQIKAVVNEIIDMHTAARGDLNASDVLKKFGKKQELLRRRVKLVFPQIKRWANITTMFSIPVIVAGIATANPLITVSGATLAGLSKIAKEGVELLSSKYSWVGFTSKDIELHI